VPVGPAEVTAEVTVEASESDGGSVAELIRAAGAAGVAFDTGPGVAGLSGDKATVLDALIRLLDAAIEAGARSIRVDVQVPEVADPH
jgi:hypothetical protein